MEFCFCSSNTSGRSTFKISGWCSFKSTEIDIADISKALGIGTADIKDAMQYWAAAGLITDFSCDCDRATLTPAMSEVIQPENTVEEPSVSVQADILEETSHSEIIEHTVSVHTLTQTEDKKTAEKPIKTPPRMKKPDGVYIAQRIAQCAEVGFLMQEAQQILGRTISPALSSTLLMIHDDYGLPVEVIIMLLMYVKSIHEQHQYIEAVAKNWARRN
ncbi:MAG: DnaD domain protein [Acutalibacteraceae bacterium]